MDAIKKLLLPVLLFLASCTTMQAGETGFFTPAELSVLDKTTQAMDYGYGYDDEVELNYVFVFSSGEMSPERREKEFASAVKDMSASEMLPFFDRVYRLESMMRYKINKYRLTRKWKYYTYLQNYLLPPMDTYLSLVQKYLLIKAPDLESNLPKRKVRIDKNVAVYFYNLEMEEFKKDFYY